MILPFDMVPGMDAYFETCIAGAAHDLGAALADVGAGQQRAVEQGLEAVVLQHRGARHLFHETRTERARDCAPGVVRPEAEQKGGAGVVLFQHLDQPRHAFARAAVGVDVDFESEFHWRRCLFAERDVARTRQATSSCNAGACADGGPSARILDCARMKSTSARNRRSLMKPTPNR